MNILCVDSPYAEELRAMGHNVLAPDFPEGVLHLPSILRMHNFQPDLLIQHERLSPRLILGGVEHMPCPTVFVSIDAHLNMFWHKYYARLFDMVLTPHLSLYRALDKRQRIPAVKRFGPKGYDFPFTPYAQREHDAVFVGVLTEHRPARMAMVNLLAEKCGLHRPEKHLNHQEMFDLFMRSRIIPNESIAREVNFRLFEGISCGSLVISQDIGEDQNAHFKPGTEFETYADALELVDKVKFYSANTEAAEKIGRAGWARVQREHLPAHRASQLAGCTKTSQYRAQGKTANFYFYLTLLQLARAGSHPMPVEWFLERWPEIEQNSLAHAARLGMLVEATCPKNAMYSQPRAVAYKDEAMALMALALKEARHADSLEFNLASAMCALFLDKPDLARAFWLRQLQNMRVNGLASAEFEGATLTDKYEHYLAWGKLLISLGRYAQPGFGFRCDTGFVPACAFECMLMAQDEAGPQRLEWLPEMTKICSAVPGFGYWGMGFLAEISLAAPDNWRKQADYAVSCLQNYRLDAGLHELAQAKAKAAQAGESAGFKTALEGIASSGYIRSVLFNS